MGRTQQRTQEAKARNREGISSGSSGLGPGHKWRGAFTGQGHPREGQFETRQLLRQAEPNRAPWGSRTLPGVGAAQAGLAVPGWQRRSGSPQLRLCPRPIFCALHQAPPRAGRLRLLHPLGSPAGRGGFAQPGAPRSPLGVRGPRWQQRAGDARADSRAAGLRRGTRSVVLRRPHEVFVPRHSAPLGFGKGARTGLGQQREVTPLVPATALRHEAAPLSVATVQAADRPWLRGRPASPARRDREPLSSAFCGLCRRRTDPRGWRCRRGQAPVLLRVVLWRPPTRTEARAPSPRGSRALSEGDIPARPVVPTRRHPSIHCDSWSRAAAPRLKPNL